MANRALLGKLAKQRARQDRLNGVHGRFLQGDHREHDAKRAVAMPEHTIEAKHAMRVAAAECNLVAKRISCGRHVLKDTVTISDEHKRSRLMRKARGEIVRPESGRICAGQAARKIAAPPMKGFLQSCWSTDREWKLYTK